jgi:hypothetical protein
LDGSEAGLVSLFVSGAITPDQYTRARADGPLTSEYISEQTEAIVHDPENDSVRHARIAHAGRVLADCDLRDQNSRLKKLVADLSLDKDMLHSVEKTHEARSTESASGALAGGVEIQRAPRLRADGGAEIERPVSKPERWQPDSGTAARAGA